MTENFFTKLRLFPAAAVACGTMACGSVAHAASVPAPSYDPAPSSSEEQTLVVAGGCFWGIEAVFRHIKGVMSAESGYAGGGAASAAYDKVSKGDTGHAEVVRVTYDPEDISLGQLLQVYFAVAHDPTQLNRQGNDVGTQYRSAIFYADEGQKEIAARYMTQLDAAHVFSEKIVTTLEPLTVFYKAEDYHQDYVARNPEQMYVYFHDLPKIRRLEEQFPDMYRDPI